jgi:succinyl-CoA synthetase alpha subunit
VTAAADIAEEYYVSIMYDRSEREYLLMFSLEGGVEIEELAATNPSALIKRRFSPLAGLTGADVAAVLAEAQSVSGAVSAEVVSQLTTTILALWEVYKDNDATLVEVNPLGVVKADGGLRVEVLDAKISLDDNAKFRHAGLFEEFYDIDAEDPLEAIAKERGINYVRMDGSVGIIGNGAGLVMSTLDVVALAGRAAAGAGSDGVGVVRPANFLDIGGGASAEQMRESLNLVVADPGVKVVFVNIFGGLTRCELVAEGLLEAVRGGGSSTEGARLQEVPIVVRFDGNGRDEGLKILQESAVSTIHTAATMDDAAALAVGLASGLADARAVVNPAGLDPASAGKDEGILSGAGVVGVPAAGSAVAPSLVLGVGDGDAGTPAPPSPDGVRRNSIHPFPANAGPKPLAVPSACATLRSFPADAGPKFASANSSACANDASSLSAAGLSSLVPPDARVIVQGITGSEGWRHTVRMLNAGTNIVGGTNPRKAGQVLSADLDSGVVVELPVFGTVAAAFQAVGANISVLFIPPAFAKAAAVEAIEAGVELVVIITEGIPQQDSAFLVAKAQEAGVRVVGPNCPGLVTFGGAQGESDAPQNLGIVPDKIAAAGPLALVSKSGTLTYQLLHDLREVGFQEAVGIGGDAASGTTHIDALAAFEANPEVKLVLMIGEIGGDAEERAAAYIAEHVTKPVVAYVAGFEAPEGKTMGHAGAIISAGKGDARSKAAALKAAGVHVGTTPSETAEIARSLLAS